MLSTIEAGKQVQERINETRNEYGGMGMNGWDWKLQMQQAARLGRPGQTKESVG